MTQAAFTTTIKHEDGSESTFMKRERPHLTFDDALNPIALFTGLQNTLQNDPQPPHCTWANHRNASLYGYCDGSFTHVQRIKASAVVPTPLPSSPPPPPPPPPRPFTTGTLVQGGAPCTTDNDCQLNGVCSSVGACTCDAAWVGANCSFVFAMPTVGAAYPAAVGSTTTGADSGPISSWGGRPVLGNDGKWHLYVAEFANSCGINSWKNNSQVVHAVSATNNPAGPFTRVGVVIPPFSHNPDAFKTGDGTYVIIHIGAGNSSYSDSDGSNNSNGNNVNAAKRVADNANSAVAGSEGGQFVDCSSNGNGTTPANPKPAKNTPLPNGYTPGQGIHVS